MLPWLDPQTPSFPPTGQALQEPNGLLAAGGQLSIEWLLAAYHLGIFPWFNEGDPILWWTPSPRMVIYPDDLHISRSLRKVLKREEYQVTINRDFSQVINACAEPREEVGLVPSTWITPAMATAYQALHQAGYAQSVEVWQQEHLIGGLYGVALGKIFFGESMFSRASNASKIAMAHLVEYLKQWQFRLIDCQVYNDHLSSLGAIEIDRSRFEKLVHKYTRAADEKVTWKPKEVTLGYDYWSNNSNRQNIDHE